MQEIKNEKCNIIKFNTYSKSFYNQTWDCFTFNGAIGNQKYSDYPNKMYSEDPKDINYTLENIMINLSVDKCDPKKHNMTCPSEQDYEANYNKSNSVFMRYMFFDSTINPKDYSHPYRQYQMESNFFVNKKISTTKTVELSLIEVNTDDGYVVEKENKQYFLEHDNTFDFTSTANKFGFSLLFQLSKKINVFNRSYMKIQGLLAEIGGFMSLIEYIVLFFFKFYYDNDMSTTMINKAFNLEIKESEDEEKKNMELVELDTVRKVNMHIVSGSRKGIPKESKESRELNIDSISISNDNDIGNNDNMLDTPLQSIGTIIIYYFRQRQILKINRQSRQVKNIY